MGEIASDPLSAAIAFPNTVTRLHEYRPHAGISSTLDVTRFVADKIGLRQIEAMIVLGFENHARRRLAPR
jgi:hypothetical protein